MFETLKGKLQTVFDGLAKRGALSEADVDAALREVRLALLDADVALPVVKNFIEKLRAAGVHWDTVEQVASDGLPLDGQTWVITGALDSMARDEAKAKLQAMGAKVSGSISAKTTALLAGEKAGSKLTKAEKLGVKVVSEEEFLAMVGE